MEEGRALLEKGIDRLGLQYTQKGLSDLVTYHLELLRWGKRINLIGKKQDDLQVIENHFLDSLLLLKCLNENQRLIDVGTGAGFPGLVCKCLRPDIPLILVEPRLKRVSFLRHMVRLLNLDHVTIRDVRIEEMNLNCSKDDCVTSRAVAEMSEFLDMVGTCLQPGSHVLCMKGPRWKDELDRSEKVRSDLGLLLVTVEEYTLPFSGAPRAILTFRREICR